MQAQGDQQPAGNQAVLACVNEPTPAAARDQGR
jgi:hypothetical protein